MKFEKFTNLFSLLIVCLFAFTAISCKESSSPTESSNKILTKDAIEKLEAAADKVMMEIQAPGMMAYISVEGEGEGIYITRGVSNLVTNEPMNINNFWRIGSVTKTIVGEAVLILVDEGKVDLNNPISFYLPELNIPSGDKITIPMLANMTSGLPECFDETLIPLLINSNGQAVFTPEQSLINAFKLPMQFEPGSKYEYCNTNYLLLGFLIKKVTGKPVIDVLNEKIFQPLGMKNTFWPNTGYLPYPYSHGYYLHEGSLLDVTNWNPSWGDAAGILISNIYDMKIWSKEMVESKLLSAKMKSERFAWVDSEIPGVSSSGFGVEKFQDWIFHDGTLPGYNTKVYCNTVNKITIIIYTTSMDGLPGGPVLVAFMNIISPLK